MNHRFFVVFFIFITFFQSMQGNLIAALHERWLAESNGDSRITLYWFYDGKKQRVRDIAISKKSFDVADKEKISVCFMLWSKHGRYLYIKTQNGTFDTWDADYNQFIH